MSWYKDTDGKIIVCEDCAHLVEEHIGFQMGTVRRPDGKLVLMDPDLLSMCGPRKRRPHTRKPTTYKTPLRACCDVIVKRMQKRLQDRCPAKKSACRFYNDVFFTCSASDEAFEKENLPCMTEGGQP